MGDEGGGRWRLRFVGFNSRRNLTDTVAPFPKGISRKGKPGLNMSLYRKKTYFCENSGKMVKKVCLIRIYVL